MALNPNVFVDGVMNGVSLHIEPPSYLLVSANRSCMRVSVHMAKKLTCYMLLYF